MVKYVFLAIWVGLLCLGATVAVAAAENSGETVDSNSSNQRLAVYWGSLRTPYAEFISGLDYALQRISPEIPIGLEARVESYGSFYLISTSSMDFQLSALWRLPDADKAITWSLGLGYLVEARFFYDSRSAAKTSYAPFARFEFDGRFPLGGPNDPHFGIRLPLDCAVYRTGFAIGLLPEFRLELQTVYFLVELKGRLLVAPDAVQPLAEFRWDSYIGVGLRF